MGDITPDFVEYNGISLLQYPTYVENAEKTLHDIKAFPTRTTDIMICASLKSGSHWLFEIISMLVSGELEYSEDFVNTIQLDLADHEVLAQKQDPRIIHTHLPYRYLPGDEDEKEYKIVHIMRNSKDRVVSAYEFAVGKMGFPDDYSWEDFFNYFVLKPDRDVFGNSYTYVKEWEQQIQRNPSRIHLMFYEDLIKNFKDTVKKLAKFLDISVTDSFYDKVEVACNLENMKNNKPDDTVIFDKEGKSTLYRKGQVGDWKHYFTEEQEKKFNEMYEKEMKGSNLRFVDE